MATEGQKTIERMTAGLTEHQCRAFAALVRDVRDGEPDSVVLMRVAQCRTLTGVDDFGDMSEEHDGEDEQAPSEPAFPPKRDVEARLTGLADRLGAMKFEELKTFAAAHKVDVAGLQSKADVCAAIMKVARAEASE